MIETIEGWDAAVRAARPDAAGDTVLRPGAALADVEALEARLGTRLPPSYRGFLLRSDGAAAQPGVGLTTSEVGLLDCAQVGWFRDRERSYVDIWSDLDLEVTPDGLHTGFHGFPEARYLDLARRPESIEHKRGHVRYVLQISGEIDGYTILLNPLVVDQHGEWEAWDFGSKLPGAARHRSFAALLAADAQRQERCARQGQIGPARPDLETLLAQARPGTAIDERHQALWWLGRTDDPRALPALIAAAREPDADDRLLAAVVGPLARSPDPQARAAAVDILARDDVEDFVVSEVWRSGADAVWEAWRRTGREKLLVQLAHLGDQRAVEPLCRAIVDASVAPQTREWLARYAWWPGDDAVVPALVQAALDDRAPAQPIAEALERLGAREDAVAVFARGLRAGDRYGQVAQRLSWIDTPEASAVLLEHFRDDPTPALARGLGHFASPDAVAALLAAAGDPELRLAVIDGLERMPGSDAAAALATLDDVLALRALARRRDTRALAPLLDLLQSSDDTDRLQAADGLRDLRDPAAAAPLLAALRRGGSQDFVATAAHALVSMATPEAADALALVARSDDPDLRRLAEIWPDGY
ncbi:MAG TPA: SMI1/KNR4 family protein [Solirubrobacteraceae bacterium]